MLRLKVSAVLFVLCSVIMLGGCFLLLNTTSYTIYGESTFYFGLGLYTLMNIINLIVGVPKRRLKKSKELYIFGVATAVIPLFGLVLSCVSIMLVTRPIVWVGIVGSSLMIIGWAMSFLEELWIERLEEENINQAELT